MCEWTFDLSNLYRVNSEASMHVSTYKSGASSDVMINRLD